VKNEKSVSIVNDESFVVIVNNAGRVELKMRSILEDTDKLYFQLM